MDEPLSGSRQVTFHQLLVAARKKWLIDALRAAVAEVDPAELKRQLTQFVPTDAQRLLAAAGIRDEEVFPVPSVLEQQPTLVGYYRLLLGISQKTFYRAGSGVSIFRSMEVSGTLREAQKVLLPEFCQTMSQALASLVRQISPTVTPRDISELPLLTLGAQLQGGNNNTIGQQAIVDVFLAIADLVKDFTTERGSRKIVLRNSSGRTVIVAFGQDPDVRIVEEFGGSSRNRVAIEIKGGTDISNVHNRAGEAEKSHQKARNEGFREFWTIILRKGVDLARLQRESPTTDSWFDAAQVLGRQGDDWNDFKSRIAGAVGIPEA